MAKQASISGRAKDFVLRHHCADSIQRLPAVNRLEREDDHSPPSNATVKNAFVSSILLPCLRGIDNFTVTFSEAELNVSVTVTSRLRFVRWKLFQVLRLELFRPVWDVVQ
jgi:hypothetical protein